MLQQTFKQLTLDDRIQLEVLSREGKTNQEIGESLGVDRTTVWREKKERGTPTGYHAKMAEVNYRVKRQACRPKRKVEELPVGSYIIGRIRAGWSPETISGRLDTDITDGLRPPTEAVSHETIYNFVYQSEFGRINKLYEYLRRGKKHRTKQRGRKSQTERIPNRISVHERPEAANSRTEIGHWETDSVIYPGKLAINSLLERKSRFALLTKLERKTAELTKDALINRLAGLPAKTLAFDNGLENIKHTEVAETLSLQTYFCDPYSSWQKGAVENLNGLLRRYLPRGKSIQGLTQTELDDIAWELNNRPRKCLGFRTPQEVLELEYQLTDVAIRV